MFCIIVYELPQQLSLDFQSKIRVNRFSAHFLLQGNA